MSKPKGLTFVVEYPEPMCNNLSSESKHYENEGNHFKSQDVESKGEQKAIVVVLLGWTGAKDKQLTKYSDIYLTRGCIVVRCLIPVKVVTFDNHKLPILAAELVNQLREKKFHSHPTFLHAFSNCGAYLYSFMLKEIARQKNPAEFDIRGTIFDSAPFWPTFKTGHAAVSTVLHSFTRYTFGLATLLSVIIVTIGLVIKMCAFINYAWVTSVYSTMKSPRVIDQKFKWYPILDYQTRIWKLKNHAFLFLYSEMDAITPSKEVEDVAGATRDRGNPVQLVKFEGSSHVLHYKMYPKEYVAAVTKFMDETMESNIGPAIYWDE